MKNDAVSILLVEDDEIDAMSVQRAFKKVKVTNPLFIAEDGLQALQMLRGEATEKITPTPKIILLDINMPRMNGIEFLQELRADPNLKSICVIILTTSNEERDIVAAYDLNVAGYILKPVEPDKFVEAIRNLDLFWSIIELP